MGKTKKITIGTFRPLWEEILKRMSTSCPRCQKSFVSSSGPWYAEIHECWQRGHFDTPVYQEVTPAFPEKVLNSAGRLKDVFDRGVCYEDRSEATDDFLYELVAWMTSEEKKRKSATPTERDLSGESRDDEFEEEEDG